MASRSAFVRSDGRAVNDQGEPGIRLETSPGHYYLVAKHRNHIAAMSAEPVAFTNYTITYDFTTNWTQYHEFAEPDVTVPESAWSVAPLGSEFESK